MVMYHRSNDQDDLADMGAGFHAGVRGRGLYQRERAVDDWLDAPGGNEWQYILFDRPRDGAFVGDRASAKGGTGVNEALEHDATEIDGGFR